MNPVVILIREHEKIEMELSELDFIMGEPEINYSNLVHTFWKLCGLWEAHELKEEEVFKVMEEEGFKIPVGALLLEHKALREHVDKISAAINSGSDFKVREALAKNMRVLVDTIRAHVKAEEDVLSGVIVGNFSDEGNEKIKGIVGKFED